MPHYLVTGRQHGDDEATSACFEVNNKDNAIHEFTAGFLNDEQMRELTELQAHGQNAEDAARFDLLVYIDGVFKSATPITNC